MTLDDGTWHTVRVLAFRECLRKCLRQNTIVILLGRLSDGQFTDRSSSMQVTAHPNLCGVKPEQLHLVATMKLVRVSVALYESGKIEEGVTC